MNSLEPCMIANVFKDPLGDVDAAGFTDRFYSGGHIESIPKSIDPVIAYVSNVDTDPDRDFGVLFILYLHLHCTFDRIDTAVEDAQGAVTEKLVDLAFIFFMQFQQDFPVAGTKHVCPFFIDMHQVGISNDISKDDSG